MEAIPNVSHNVVSMGRVSLPVTHTESKENFVGFREIKHQDSSPVIPLMIHPPT